MRVIRRSGGHLEPESLDRLRADFIATTSHELRTPVTAVHGAALTLLAHPGLDEAARQQLLTMIERESAHLCDLVEELLIAATLRARAVAPATESVDLAAVVRDVVGRATPSFEITLVVEPEIAYTPGSYADVRRIVGAVFAKAGSEAHARLTASRHWARLRVEGPGLAEHPEWALEPFARRGGPDDASDDGLSLSLFIAKELARGLGGRLLARGHGLVLELPLVPSHRSPLFGHLHWQPRTSRKSLEIGS